MSAPSPTGKPPAAGPAKATFKHSLPATFECAYFDTLEQNLKKDAAQYDNEHNLVNADIVRAAQMASIGFSEDANLGPATQSFATGKPLNTPQRDQYNGPLQAFMQHGVSALSKVSVWQHWVKCRDQLVEDFAVFARRCFRGEIRAIDPPTLNSTLDGVNTGQGDYSSPLTKGKSFHGGNMSGSFSLGGGGGGSFAQGGGGGSASPLTRTGTFARMPGAYDSPTHSPRSAGRRPSSAVGGPASPMARPGTAQAPSREMNLTDFYVRCGTNSYFDPERLVLIHVWDNSRAARAFVQQWRTIAQVIFEHRIEMIHAPISVVSLIDGTFVSVTAIPPLTGPKFLPIRNVGSRPDRGSLIDHLAENLIRAIQCNDDEELPIKEGLTLHPGLDGRYYLLDIPAGIFPKFENKQVPHPLIIPRPELMLFRVQEQSTGKVSMIDFAMDHGVERVVDDLYDQVAKADPPLNVDAMIRDNRIGQAFHDLGLNMCFLGPVYESVRYRMRSCHSSETPLLSTIASSLITEMIGRVLKHFIRLDLHAGAAGGRERDLSKHCTNQKARLDVVNRVARMAVGKKEDFLDDHVLPFVRTKYLIPEFSCKWNAVNPGTCLKLISSRTAAEFGQAEGRFSRFIPAAAKDLVMVSCNAALEGLLCDDSTAAEKGCRSMWDQSEACIPESKLYETLLIRATAASIMTGTCKSKVPLNKSVMDPMFSLHLQSLTAEVLAKETRKVDYLKGFLEQLRSSSAEAKARSRSGLCPESTLLSLKLIQSAPIIEALTGGKKSAEADPHLLQDGVKSFVDQEQVDFVYSAQHAQALRDIEGMIPVMKDFQLSEFLEETVEGIVDALQKVGRLGSAAKYVARVTSQLVGVSLAESLVQSAKSARHSYTLHVKSYGVDDPRTSIALYTLGVLALTSCKSRSGAVNLCRKILTKANSLPPAQQSMFYRTGNVFVVLHKVMTVLDDLGDTLNSSTFKSHVSALARLHNAAATIQCLGRGYIARKGWRRGFASLPTSPTDTSLSVALVQHCVVSPSQTGSFAGSPLKISLSSTENSPTNFSQAGGAGSPLGSASPLRMGSFSLPNTGSFSYQPPAAVSGGGGGASFGFSSGTGMLGGGGLGSPGLGSPMSNNSLGGSFAHSSSGGWAPPPSGGGIGGGGGGGLGGSQSPTGQSPKIISPRADPGLPPTPPAPSVTASKKSPEELVVSNLDSESDEEETNFNASPTEFRRKPTFSHMSNSMLPKNNRPVGNATAPALPTQPPPKALKRKLVLVHDSPGPGSPTGGFDDDDDDANKDALFEKCDADGDGFVSAEDCVRTFRGLNVMSPSELRTLFNGAARNAAAGGGRMNRREFSVVVTKAGL